MRTANSVRAQGRRCASPGGTSSRPPPLRSITVRATCRPRPDPRPSGLVVKRGEKSRGRSSSAIPAPSSETRTSGPRSLPTMRTSTRPVSSTASAALTRRLVTACSTACAVPWPYVGPPGWKTNRGPSLRRRYASRSTDRCTTGSTANRVGGRRCGVNRSCQVRNSSSRRATCWATRRNSSEWPTPVLRASSSSPALMPISGCRISWISPGPRSSASLCSSSATVPTRGVPPARRRAGGW